ncbi:MAG: hypothetical protein JWO17_584 [Actinomycetia bacterium]|nr:hypothetical protein [Actinomycetes bacterium]
MTALRHVALWQELRSPRFALFLATVALCLIRARDQPSIDVSIGGTTASIVPADIALIALALVAVVAIARRGLERAAWPAAISAALFCLWLLATAAANSATAFVSGAKVVELTALALGALAFLRLRAHLDALADVLILFTLVADVVGLVKFVTGGGGRQASFLGEHDFAALATLPLLYGLALLYARGRDRRAWLAIAVGGLGCVLGAALASLLGLYIGAVVLLVLHALTRRLTLRDIAATLAVVVAVTGGTLAIRSGDLGFLQSWFGKPASRPGQYASSWSQRLIYTYVGGRIFIANPLLGTGWWGDLPPKEFDAYLPAARRRFADQPARYFPPPDKPFIPQQTYDEVLYELGAIGGVLFLALIVSVGDAAARAARRARGAAASVPAAWFAASLGALAGEGLFGGTALAATFWLITGVVVALSLRPGAGEA